MRLGRYFTLDELTVSQTAARMGLSNVPSGPALESLRALVENILDPLRALVASPVVVNSGYRSSAVNRAVGGSASSQHRLGEAADIIVPGMPVHRVCEVIRAAGLPYDQLINEFGSWVHVSYSPRHRRQFLKAVRHNGKTQYLPQD